MKKFIYFAFTLLILIAVNCLLIIKSEMNIWLSLICLVLYVIISFGLFKPEKLFKFTHWYLDKDFESCSDLFKNIYKLIIIVGMFLSAILPIWLLAPFEI